MSYDKWKLASPDDENPECRDEDGHNKIGGDNDMADILETVDLFLNGDGSGIGGRNLIRQMAGEIKRLRATLKGIEVYSSSHDDARGMAAKELLSIDR